jgi:hypothetical protein
MIIIALRHIYYYFTSWDYRILLLLQELKDTQDENFYRINNQSIT